MLFNKFTKQQQGEFMKTVICLFILFIIILISPERVTAANECISNLKYTRTYDGDTFFVKLNATHKVFSNELGVRLRGVDTAEMRGGSKEEKILANKAKMFTKNILENAKKIQLCKCKPGKYFRIICDVRTDKVSSLSDALLLNNLADPYLVK